MNVGTAAFGCPWVEDPLLEYPRLLQDLSCHKLIEIPARLGFAFAGQPKAAVPTYLSSGTAVLFVLLEDEGIGHAGNVIADDARQAFVLCLLLILMRQRPGMSHPEGE